MVFVLYSLALLFISILPAVLVWRNLPLFGTASREHQQRLPSLSVLIPARNEASGIEATLRSVLDNRQLEFEVIVLDDHSSDDTAAIVTSVAEDDQRVRLIQSQELPTHWNGKQFACWQLAQHARHETLLFLDADVRVRSDCLVRSLAELQKSQADLLSGFPAQAMETLGERLLIPLIYYLLLGYLPLDQMRKSKLPALGAGCGQMFLAGRDAYFACGGHSSIPASRHDGVKLPRAFRTAGLRTDLFDASDIAQVRMYRGFFEVTRGLLKNATEGMANSQLIAVFSVLLIGGSVLPIVSTVHALFYSWPLMDSARYWSTLLLGLATCVSFFPRYLIARRWHLSMMAVVLHPISVLYFVGLQWWAFCSAKLGAKPVRWRGRH